jgi:hypothetical protein
VLARRDRREGPGVVVADVEPGRRTPVDDIPAGFWFHDRGALSAFTWFYQRHHGKRWYRRHTVGRPTAQPERA